MKRDMDLVRAILLKIEEHDHGFAPDKWTIEGYTEEQINYNAYIMLQGGLVEGADMSCQGDESPEAQIRCLTWVGHEFLEAARDPGRWNQARKLLKEAGGGAIAIWTPVLTDLVKKNLGLG